MIYFKDLFIFSKSKDIDNIIYKNLEDHYSKITNYNADTSWDSCITTIENTYDYIERNASLPLAINGMIVELKNIITEALNTYSVEMAMKSNRDYGLMGILDEIRAVQKITIVQKVVYF